MLLATIHESIHEHPVVYANGSARDVVGETAKLGEHKSSSEIVINSPIELPEAISLIRFCRCLSTQKQESALAIAYDDTIIKIKTLDPIEKAKRLRQWLATEEKVEKASSLYIENEKTIDGPFPLPPEIKYFKGLKILVFSNNDISILPDEICGLTELIHLDVSENKLSSLPANIGLLKKMEKISCWMNQFKIFPFQVQELSGIKEINFRRNLIELLPRHLKFAQDKVIIDLSLNRCVEVPAGLLSNPRLTIIAENLPQVAADK